MLFLIYARTRNYCIGDKGRVPWNLPDEYTKFNELTDNKPIIMGRRTYEDHQSVLPGRLNIVVSKQTDYALHPSIKLANSLAQAESLASNHCPDYFVIGGVNLICDALNRADVVYETVIDTNIQGDTHLPAFDFSTWSTTILHQHNKDASHEYAFTIYRHNREGII